MRSIRDRYRRFDARVRTLSRAAYALTVGVSVFAATLAVSALLGDLAILQAVVMGLAFTVVYYIVNPNESDAPE